MLRTTRNFALAVGGLVVGSVGGLLLMQRAQEPRRLGAAKRGEITDAATLKKRLTAFARDAKKQLADHTTTSEVDQIFIKLRRRLDNLSSASSGFFPEANDMNDAALAELKVQRDAAAEAVRVWRDGESKRLRAEEIVEARERHLNEWWKR